MNVDDLLGKAVPVEELITKVAELSAASVLPSYTSRYGLACIVSERGAKLAAEGAPSPPELWSNLLAGLNVPGGWERVDPQLAMARRPLEAPKFRALLNRTTCRLPLARIDAIGAPGARKLADVGITTADGLLRRAALPSDRADLATSTHLESGTLETWARLAEMAVVFDRVRAGCKIDPPLDAYDAVTLVALATIRTVAELAKAEPHVLADAMDRANATEHVAVFAEYSHLIVVVGAWQNSCHDWISAAGDGRDSMVRASEPEAAAPQPTCCCCEKPDTDSGKGDATTTKASDKKASKPAGK